MNPSKILEGITEMTKIYVLWLEMKLFYYDYVFKFQVRRASIIL